MRVTSETVAGQGRAEQPAARFSDALLRAHRRDDWERAGASGPAARARPPEPRRPRLEGERQARDEERAPPVSDPARREPGVELSPVPELAALARALPVAVDAARLRDGATLALSFGRSLEVELRSSPAGLEVVLRPESRLLRAAEAELPRLVAALRVRGVVVARADVRARAGGGGRAR